MFKGKRKASKKANPDGEKIEERNRLQRSTMQPNLHRRHKKNKYSLKGDSLLQDEKGGLLGWMNKKEKSGLKHQRTISEINVRKSGGGRSRGQALDLGAFDLNMLDAYKPEDQEEDENVHRTVDIFDLDDLDLGIEDDTQADKMSGEVIGDGGSELGEDQADDSFDAILRTQEFDMESIIDDLEKKKEEMNEVKEKSVKKEEEPSWNKFDWMKKGSES